MRVAILCLRSHPLSPTKFVRTHVDRSPTPTTSPMMLVGMLAAAAALLRPPTAMPRSVVSRHASARMSAFDYENIVASKLSFMNSEQALSYIDRHSTRFMLAEAGVSEAEVAEARAIIVNAWDWSLVRIGCANPPAGWVGPKKPVTSWYDQGRRLNPPPSTFTAREAEGWGIVPLALLGDWSLVRIGCAKPPVGWVGPKKPVSSWYDQGQRLSSSSSDFAPNEPEGWGIVPFALMEREAVLLSAEADALSSSLKDAATETNRLFMQMIYDRAKLAKVGNELAAVAAAKAAAEAKAQATPKKKAPVKVAKFAKAVSRKQVAKASPKKSKDEKGAGLNNKNAGVLAGLAAAIAAAAVAFGSNG